MSNIIHRPKLRFATTNCKHYLCSVVKVIYDIPQYITFFYTFLGLNISYYLDPDRLKDKVIIFRKNRKCILMYFTLLSSNFRCSQSFSSIFLMLFRNIFKALLDIRHCQKYISKLLCVLEIILLL